MKFFGIVSMKFETISGWRNIGWIITLFIFCVAFETLHLTINHLKLLEVERAVVMVLKWLATRIHNQAIANIYGTRVNIMIKYTILIPKVLGNKDKKISHFINIPHDQRLVNIIQAFKELTLMVYTSSLLKNQQLNLLWQTIGINMTTIMWFCKLFVIPI
jgi:hypothetical protein